MDIEVLKSYLVSLGFKVDQPQLRKFELGLKDAGAMVESATGGVIGNLLKWQMAATGAFVGVSGAVVGMADHVATADQKYRLLGMRMFMNTEQARKMQMSLDALGVSLEDAIWDSETRARFIEMGELQDKLSKQLGVNFEANMRTIRDVKQRFQELGVTIEYISMAFISRLVEKLGPNLEELQAKFETFIGYVIQNVPAWADAFAENIAPVLKETWSILRDTGLMVRDLIVQFTNLVGLLTGDKSIEGTEFSFHKLAGAIHHVVTVVGGMLHTLINAEQVLIHFAGAVIAVLSGRFSDAKKEALTAISFLGPDAGGIIGGVLGTIIAPGVGTAAGAALGAGLGGAAKLLTSADNASTSGGSQVGGSASSGLADQIRRKAEQLGVSPALALAEAQQESGVRQFNADGSVVANPNSSARGIFQLLKGTAEGLGVDRNDASQNIDGGVRYLAQMLKKYNGSEERAIAAYYWGPGNLDKALASHSALPPEVLNYVRGVEAKEGNSMTVGDIQIQIMQPNATPREIHASVLKAVRDAQATENRRNIAQLSHVG